MDGHLTFASKGVQRAQNRLCSETCRQMFLPTAATLLQSMRRYKRRDQCEPSASNRDRQKGTRRPVLQFILIVYVFPQEHVAQLPSASHIDLLVMNERRLQSWPSLKGSGLSRLTISWILAIILFLEHPLPWLVLPDLAPSSLGMNFVKFVPV